MKTNWRKRVMAVAAIAGILALSGCPQPESGGPQPENGSTDTYTVTFNAGGGTPAPAAQTVTGGGKVTTPAAMTKAGFTFGGWFKEAALTSQWDFATDTVTGDITLYARWVDGTQGTYHFTTPAQYRDMVSLTGGTIIGNSAYYYDPDDDYWKGVFIENRTVTLSPFQIAKYETTYELWYEVRQWAASNGYTFAKDAGREGEDGVTGALPTPGGKTEPVTMISWGSTVVWCNAYSEMSGKEPVYYTDDTYTAVLKTSTGTTVDNAKMKTAANGYRLPTEAEWEYAARGGGTPSTSGPFAYIWAGTNTESELGNYAWYNSNSGLDTHPVGTKAANTAELYDMSGNVEEWCWDWWGTVGTGIEIDPVGPASGTTRVYRGGSFWYGFPSACAVALRTNYDGNPGYGYGTVGFRVASRP